MEVSMRKKLKILLFVFVAIYLLSLIVSVGMALSDESFHLGEWLLNGGPYSILILLYHGLMITGCSLIVFLRNHSKTPLYAFMAMAWLVIGARIVSYIKNIVMLIKALEGSDEVIGKIISDALAQPGGILLEVAMLSILLLLVRESAAMAGIPSKDR